MITTSSSSDSRASPAEASSSRSSDRDRHAPAHADDQEQDAQDLLNDDPLGEDLGLGISFKRKAKPTSTFPIPRFLSSFTNRDSSPSQRRQNGHANTGINGSVPGVNPAAYDALPFDNSANGSYQDQDAKEQSATDWYAEGPGRRVGYDDLTAIDWIFEYAKERQRQRVLVSSTTGILGYAQQIADASQIWWVLIATGIAAGGVAAFIDVVSDWLGDLKGGVCRNIDQGGRFYLNKTFCCWGYNQLAACKDWQSWSDIMHVNARAGGNIIEFIMFVLLSVVFAACAAILVKNFSVYAKHSGIPEIKTVLGGFVIRRFMGAWTLVTKSLGLCLVVASGMWLGKEGPLVHVACCCAIVFLKFFPSLNHNEARKREVLSAAAAAGISVAFGSPVGGVLFSLEQLSYYFPDKTMWQSFVCAMIAAVTLQAFNPFRTGKLVLFEVTYHSGWHGFEMIPFAILGVLGGLYGGLFIKLNMRIAEWRRNRTYLKGPVLEVILVALVTAIVNFPIKFMRAQASELVYTLFAECVDITDDQLDLCRSGIANTGVVALLIVAAILGIFLASITFGLQIPAGIILPSIAIGALYGRAIGLIAQVWQEAHPNFFAFASCEPDIQCITPGTYAIVGAASALAGTTRMTISIVVIMFELTGALTYVLPIMIAVMIGKWVGDSISPLGIYEAWIRFNGYPFLDNKDDNSATVPDIAAAQVMTRLDDLMVINATGHTIRSLATMLSQNPYRGFPVIDNPEDATLLGYISRTELHFALQSAQKSRSLPPETEAFFQHQALADPASTLDLRPWMDQTPITLNAKATFGLTVSMFQRLGLRYVIFTERGALRGLLTKKDVWSVLNGADARAQNAIERDSQATFLGQPGQRDEARGGLLEEDELNETSRRMSRDGFG